MNDTMEIMDLTQLLDMILSKIDQWSSEEIINQLISLGNQVKQEIDDKYLDEKYRIDRNEILAYFSAIKKFNQFNLPFTKEHLIQLTNTTKGKIRPYPLYSGIVINLSI